MGLVRLVARRGRRVFRVAARRQPTPRAIPVLGNDRVGGEAGLGLVTLDAVERDALPGGGLAALGFSHRTGTHTAAADCVTTCYGWDSLGVGPGRGWSDSSLCEQ